VTVTWVSLSMRRSGLCGVVVQATDWAAQFAPSLSSQRQNMRPRARHKSASKRAVSAGRFARK
jgi:hypothetical protein